MRRPASGTDFALARVGGLRSRLLGTDGLRDLLTAPTAAARRDALTGSIWGGIAEGADVAGTEAALEDRAREEARRTLRDLDPTRRRLVDAFLLVDDARALRGALRAQGGAPGTDRSSPLLDPTPALDRARLREIAACPDVASAASRLEAWGSPLAKALRESGVDLRKPGARAAAEGAIERAASLELARVARGSGPDRAALRSIASARADLDAAAEILSLSAGSAAPPRPVDAGTRLPPTVLRRIAALRAPDVPGAVAGALRDLLGDPAEAADALCRPSLADHRLGGALARHARRVARALPLTVAVPIAWLVEVREQLRRVRLLVRATAEGFPAQALVDLLEA